GTTECDQLCTQKNPSPRNRPGVSPSPATRVGPNQSAATLTRPAPGGARSKYHSGAISECYSHTLHWHAQTSMLKTLGAKHRSTVTKMAARYRARIETSDGPRTCYEARKHREGKKDLVARFGGITLRQDRRAVIRDPAPAPAAYPRKELIRRLRRRECELCETGT